MISPCSRQPGCRLSRAPDLFPSARTRVRLLARLLACLGPASLTSKDKFAPLEPLGWSARCRAPGARLRVLANRRRRGRASERAFARANNRPARWAPIEIEWSSRGRSLAAGRVDIAPSRRRIGRPLPLIRRQLSGAGPSGDNCAPRWPAGRKNRSYCATPSIARSD